MTSRANAINSQVQAMTAQVNYEVGPYMPPHASTMASRLRDFPRMNPSMFYGTKADEDPQDFLYEFYNILFAMGLTTGEKAELSFYQLNNECKLGTPKER